jgi:hypothetical protein
MTVGLLLTMGGSSLPYTLIFLLVLYFIGALL